jgi:hypothetical protein
LNNKIEFKEYLNSHFSELFVRKPIDTLKKVKPNIASAAIDKLHTVQHIQLFFPEYVKHIEASVSEQEVSIFGGARKIAAENIEYFLNSGCSDETRALWAEGIGDTQGLHPYFPAILVKI